MDKKTKRLSLFGVTVIFLSFSLNATAEEPSLPDIPMPILSNASEMPNDISTPIKQTHMDKMVVIPVTIGKQSKVKNDTLEYVALKEREVAHADYLKAMAATTVIIEKIKSGDYKSISESNKKKESKKGGTPFSPKAGMTPTMEFSRDSSLFSGGMKNPSSKANSNVMSKSERIKNSMPIVTDISMINGKVVIGINQNGQDYAVKLNEKLEDGYKIIAIDSITATILKPSGKKIRVYIQGSVSNAQESNSSSSSVNSPPVQMDSSFTPSNPLTGPAAPSSVVNLGTGNIGSAGFPMGTTFK